MHAASFKAGAVARLHLSEEMSPTLDALSLKYAIWARSAKGETLDIGCGDGIATAAALARGGRVLAVDPDPGLLEQLRARVPAEQHARLRTRVASLPEMDFKCAGFAAVHVARVLHHLDGEAIERSLRKFYRWLYPTGRLFLSALSPGGARWQAWLPEIARRATARARWPGFVGAGGESIHLLDGSTLRRELRLAGFEIEEYSEYPLPWDSKQTCCAVVARCRSGPLS